MKHYALGHFKEPKRNKTEARYEQTLELLRQGGEIAWYQFEGIKLRLADGAYYTPDFAVMRADGTLELHEVKGFWREAARVRIKVADENFPFKFFAVKAAGDGWSYEVIGEGA